jgi:hypothetical protein
MAQLAGEMIRLEDQGGSVEITLYVAPDAFPCSVKASTYNQAGESALSNQNVVVPL